MALPVYGPAGVTIVDPRQTIEDALTDPEGDMNPLPAERRPSAASLPSYDELPQRGGVACSWGLWGESDTLGTLNLLDAGRVRDATGSVARGTVFRLDWSMRRPDPPLFGRGPWHHRIHASEDSTSTDDRLDAWNTQSSTQWDGFLHVRRSGHGYYNGVAGHAHGMDSWARRGIVGRGVLADVSSWRQAQGRPLHHGYPDPITVDDLRATLEEQGTNLEVGDVLLIRTGWIAWYETLDGPTRRRISLPDGLTSVGLEPTEDMARFLWDTHVAAVAADNPALEIWPLGACAAPELVEAIRADPEREPEILLHSRLLAMLGIPIGELWFLEALAADCRNDGRWQFLLTSAPLRLPSGVGSPANALAVK